MKLFCEPISMHNTTDRERAWLWCQNKLGRTPTGHNPYTVWSATMKLDGTWEGPYYTSSFDEYSDYMPEAWTEDPVVSDQDTAMDAPLNTPLTQLDPGDSQPRTVGKRSCPSQADPVERLKVGDITFSGSHTPFRPVGKTRLASSSPAAAVVIGGGLTSEERAVRHLQLLKVAAVVEAATNAGPIEATQPAPDTLVKHRDSDQGPSIPSPI